MDKYIFIFIGIYIIPFYSKAQFEWLNEYSGSKNVEIYDTHMDHNENLYSTGSFNEDVAFGEDSYVTGGYFLLKHDKTGNLLWFKIIKSDSSLHTWVNKVITDAEGNIYIVGGTAEQPTGFNAFITKYDSNGNQTWMKVYKGLQGIRDLAVNASGEVAITFFVARAVTFDDVYIYGGGNSIGAKLSTSGELQWVKILGSNFNYGISNDYHTRPYAIAIDNDGSTYFTGKYAENLSIDGIMVGGSGKYNLYFAKFDNLGNCQWLKSAELTNGPYEPAPNGSTSGHGDLQIDEQGNLYVTGFSIQNLEWGHLA